MKILLDPGHGGRDSGATGGGLQEKDINLSVAQKLGVLLGRAGHRVNYSRGTDVYLSLDARAKMANDWGADLFISIHVNSATNAAARGIETFHYPGAKVGKELAVLVQNQLIALGLYTVPAHNRGVKEANFAVLRLTKMPAVLTELGFISNFDDVKLLASNQDRYAEAIYRGIDRYFKNNRKIEDVIDLSVDQFIEKVAGMIEETPKRILPSISIAQAILESNFGKSDLAVKANNLFGIKASKDWTGKYYAKITTEEKDGKKYQKQANFRQYANWQDSVSDHDSFFVTPSWRRDYYSKVLTAKNYKEAAASLTGTYATDSKYGEKLVSLIERYGLDRFDGVQEADTVHADDWKWAVELGITDGTNPGEPATREQVISMIRRSLK